MYNLPNILTISRIAVIPLIFISIYLTSFFWAMIAGILFIAASITDYLDGYLARAWNETSVFGRMLDSIADKLLVSTALVVLLVKPEMYSCNLTVIPIFVILCREILVSGMREFLSEVNVGLPVTRLAKWKTSFQMTALSMMLFRQLWIGWSYFGEVLLWVAAILTVITGYQYYKKCFEFIKAEEAKKVKAVKEVVVEAKTVKEPAKKSPAKKESAKKTSAAKAKKTAAPKKSAAKKAPTPKKAKA